MLTSISPEFAGDYSMPSRLSMITEPGLDRFTSLWEFDRYNNDDDFIEVSWDLTEHKCYTYY